MSTGHVSCNLNRLFVPECLPILAKEVFIKELYFGTVYHQVSLRLPLCHRLKFYILILIDFCFCTGFCYSLFFVL